MLWRDQRLATARLHLRDGIQCSAISRRLWSRAGYPTTFGVGAETGAHGRMDPVILAFPLQQGVVARSELAVAADAVGLVAVAGGSGTHVPGQGQGVAAGLGVMATRGGESVGGVKDGRE